MKIKTQQIQKKTQQIWKKTQCTGAYEQNGALENRTNIKPDLDEPLNVIQKVPKKFNGMYLSNKWF